MNNSNCCPCPPLPSLGNLHNFLLLLILLISCFFSFSCSFHVSILHSLLSYNFFLLFFLFSCSFLASLNLLFLYIFRRTKTEWFRRLKTKRGCRLLLKSRFFQQLHSYMQEEDLERGSEKVCLGSSFAEHNRMKRNFFHFKSLFLSKRRNEKNRYIPTRTRSSIVYNSSLYSNSTYCSASPHQFTMKSKMKRIELPTHYLEVNYRTLKAVVSYGPNIGHIPHDIRLKDLNLLLWSGNGRGQNI